MTTDRKTYVIVAANVDALPVEIPAWLIVVVDAIARARDAVIELELAASVVVQGEDTPKSKAARCRRLFEVFVQEHAHCMHDLAREFARKKHALPRDIATSFGADIGAVLVTCTNIAFRGRVLDQLVERWPEKDEESTLAIFRCMAESCCGQGQVLDWINTSLVGTRPMQTDHDA